MSKYGRNIASNFITHMISMVLGFVTSIIIARNFGPEGRGYIAYLFLIFSLISDYGHFGINNATTYFQKRSNYGVKEVYSVNLSYLFVMFSFLSFIVIILRTSGLILKEYSILLIVMALIYVLCNFIITCNNGIYVGDERLRESNIFTLVNKFISSFLIITLWVFNCLSITAYIVILIFSLALNVVLLMRKVGVQYRFKINYSLLAEEFKYGIIIYLSNLFGFLNYRVDQFMIKNMIGTKNLGVYAIGVTLAELVFLVPSSVTSALDGRLYNIDNKSIEKKTVTCKTVKYTFYMSIFVVLIGIACLRLIPILYGQEYKDAIAVTLILFTGIIFASVAKVSYSYFFVSGRPAVHMVFTFISFLTNIVLNYFMIPAFGINGAALASTCSYFVYGLSYIVYFVVKEKFPIGDLLKINREDIAILKGLIKR